MQKDLIKKLILATVSYILIVVIILITVILDVFSLRNYLGTTIFSVLRSGIPYFFAAIAFSAAATYLKILLKGKFTKPIAKTLYGFIVAIIVYYFLTIQYLPLLFQELSIYVFILISITSLYFLADFVLQSYRQTILVALLRCLVLVATAFILNFAVLNCFGTSYAVVANISLYGFLFAATTALFYPLQYSRNSIAKKLGRWIGNKTWQKILLGLILTSYILFLRAFLLQLSTTYTIIAEWLFIGALTVVAFFRMKSNLAIISAPLLLESWTKHKQELGFQTTLEFSVLTKDVDDFLHSGRKSDLLLFLFELLFARKVNANKIDSTLSEFINYQDLQNPRLIFSWDLHIAKERNLQRRKEVIERIIKSLEPELFRNTGEKK